MVTVLEKRGKNMLKKGLSFTCAMVLVGCSLSDPQPISFPLASPSASVSVAPTAEPTSEPEPTAAPTVEPTATPTTLPTSLPTAAPTSEPTPVPTLMPVETPTPLPIATSDISVVEVASFNGRVFDEAHLPLDGVTVKAKSLNSEVPFQEEKYTTNGVYTFNNAPVGVTIELTATRSGATTRRRIVVLKNNKVADPNVNRFDFGTHGSSSNYGVDYDAISDQPEVISVTPEPNAVGVYPNAGTDPDSSFVLKLRFSEPMDRNSVEDNLSIYSFNSATLSVDTSGSTTFTGSGDINSISGTRVWDKNAFDTYWNNDDTEVTFTFREGYVLPTDRRSANIPQYRVALDRDNGRIRDKSGVGNTGRKFKLTNNDFEASFKFAIRTDTLQPGLDIVTAKTAEMGSHLGDTISIRFTKPMALRTLGPWVAGGMSGDVNQAAAANNALDPVAVAANYTLTVVRGSETILDHVTWSSLGGSAVFDVDDPSQRSVRLFLPSGIDIYKQGDQVTVKVAASVLDPAGNTISSGANTATVVAQ
jgi:hypothetical protein